MLNFKLVNIAACTIFIGLLLGYSFGVFPFYYGIILLVIWLLLTGFGSLFIGWNYHFKSLLSNPSITKNQIALTFDDGPNPTFTPQVLQLLKKYNAKATFFCIGNHIETYPEIFKAIIADGHTVGNHSYSHANHFGFFSTKKVVSELQQTNHIAKSISNLDLKLFRPPFGVTNPKIKSALKITGLQPVGWNKRSLDTTRLCKEQVYKRITTNLKKGDIILLHDTSEKTIAALEQLLLFLQEQNMQSVTIDALFNIKAYNA